VTKLIASAVLRMYLKRIIEISALQILIEFVYILTKPNVELKYSILY